VSDVAPDARDRAAGLVARGIAKRFLATQALAGVDLDVGPGEVVALLGENGAGKSTLGSIVAGTITADEGTMTWNGAPYAPAAPRDALAVGIGLIHQEMRLLPDLTIAENVYVGRLPHRGGGVDRSAMLRGAQQQLQRLGLDVPATRRVGQLDVAAQQLVEIAKALTLDARLLILDEPTAALGAEETRRLFEQITRLRSEGVSFVYVSHRLDEIARIADRIVVLRDGRRVATHRDARSVPVRQLVEEMVGRSVERIFPDLDPPADEVKLAVRGLTASDGTFGDVSFDVRAGEILGIAGLVGAGRTELVRAISGAERLAGGTVEIEGRPLRLRHPGDAIAAGVVLVPEDRKGHGVVLDLSVADNVALGSLDRLSSRGWVTLGRVRRATRDAIAKLGVKGRPEQSVRTLSGGNQQKVMIAKWLAREPSVVLLDEPTRGIDIGARAAIYEVIAEMARAGLAVVIVSSDLDEVLGMAHRVLVLSRGRQTGILDREHANDVSVMELATA